MILDENNNILSVKQLKEWHKGKKDSDSTPVKRQLKLNKMRELE